MTDPDIRLRDALRRIDPPAHREGFWAELESTLGAEPPQAGAGTDQEVPSHLFDLDQVRTRRTRRRPLLAVAAAAAVVVAGVAAIELAPDERQDVEIVDTPTTTEATAPPDTTPTEPTGGDLDQAEADAAAVVDRWIAAIATGDLDTAWSLTAGPSREAFGGRTAFEQATGVFEGYGAWATEAGANGEGTVGDRLLEVAALDGDHAVVTLSGTRVAEGIEERVARAVPVVREPDGELRVVPLDPAGRSIDVVGVPLGAAEPVTLTSPIVEALVPRGAEHLRVFDGQQPDAVSFEVPGGDDDRQRMSFQVDGTPGEPRRVTIASFTPDGSAVARAFLATVPGGSEG